MCACARNLRRRSCVSITCEKVTELVSFHERAVRARINFVVVIVVVQFRATLNTHEHAHPG